MSALPGTSANSSKQALTVPHGEAQIGQRSKAQSLTAFSLALLCFFPYFALPVRSSFGLQAATVIVCALLIPVALRGVRANVLVAVYLLLTPEIVSALLNTLVARANSAALLSLVALAVCVSTVLPSAWLVERSQGKIKPFLGAASVAIFIHAGAALIQYRDFKGGQFPFSWLYKLNGSFASFDGIHEQYAVYVQRVFGLFPEPSSMAAALGPWLILLLGVSLGSGATRTSGDVVRGGIDLARLQRSTALAAGAVGVFLLLASRTGYLIPFVPILACVLWRCDWERQLGVFRHLVTIGLASALVWVVFWVVHKRSSGLSNESWSVRLLSLKAGVATPWQNAWALFVGNGPNSAFGGLSTTTGADPSTIYSLIVRYFFETGITGLLALAVIAVLVHRTLRRSGNPWLGGLVALAWLASYALATSYVALLSQWLILGLILTWDRIFPQEVSGVE